MKQEVKMTVKNELSRAAVLEDVLAERQRQDTMYGDQTHHSDPWWNIIATEENGEVARAIGKRTIKISMKKLFKLVPCILHGRKLYIGGIRMKQTAEEVISDLLKDKNMNLMRGDSDEFSFGRIPFNIPALDNLTGGGIPKKRMTLLYGPTNVGKS